jgi:hypothetical protein
MKMIAIISWIVVGFLQFAAMLNGLRDVLGRFFGVIVSLILGQLPLIGTILGIRGAVVYWHWSVLQAIGLFVGAPIIILIINGIVFRKD